jgi:hypothetical protein
MLFGGEQAKVDQLSLNWHLQSISYCITPEGRTDHCEVFKLQETLMTEVMSSLGQLDSHDILDSDTEFTVVVVSWLVGQDVSS